MKKLFSLMAIAVLAAVSFTSCSKDDDDTIAVYVVDFEEDYFTKLIDTEQYGGPLIYSADEYKWTDKETTLTSTVNKDDWSAWGMGYGWKNGFAVSNYVDANASTYTEQLAVPQSNGSKNFIVMYDDNSELSFADGKARVIEQMAICPTSYVLNYLKKNVGTGYSFYVTMTITKADNTTVDYTLGLAEDNDMLDTWSNVPMSQFGAIKKIVFTFGGSDKNAQGLLTPKYLAIDNIIVEM